MYLRKKRLQALTILIVGKTLLAIHESLTAGGKLEARPPTPAISAPEAAVALTAARTCSRTAKYLRTYAWGGNDSGPWFFRKSASQLLKIWLLQTRVQAKVCIFACDNSAECKLYAI
jgi:hypothetical protein